MTLMRERGVYFGDDYERTPSGLYVPGAAAAPARAERPVAVGLFVGAGGFDLGFHLAGWHVAAAVEYDIDATLTYLTNLGGPDTVLHIDLDLVPARRKDLAGFRSLLDEHGQVDEHGRIVVRCGDVWPHAGTGWIAHPAGDPDAPPDSDARPAVDEPAVEHFWLVDVRHLHGDEILHYLGRERGDLGCVLGGPPCQGFSMAGKRDIYDERNSLVFDFARLVVELYPQTMVMENVPPIVNMRTPEGVLVLDKLALILAEGGMGTADALKKTLLASSGAGGITRATSSRSRSTATVDDELEDEDTDDAVQEALFE